MQTKQKGTRFIQMLVALVVPLVLSPLSAGGILEPSAPPAPTMKTLNEVEPRVPIHASDLPLMITEPNSYYLAGDVNFTDTLNHAITVGCNDVTIDLMGYTLKGPDSGDKVGIYMEGRTNVEVRNGAVRDFYYGICDLRLTGKEHRVINVRAMSNKYSGIYLEGYGHMVKDCTAAKNGYRGIQTGSGCTVSGNTLYDNSSSGIWAGGSGCMVSGNMAHRNGYSGIYARYGCTVTGNTASYNELYGIYAADCCTVTGNTVYKNNQGDEAVYGGIRVNHGCLVKGNTTAYNKQHNIYVTRDDNTIEENLVTNCAGYGIYFKAAGNFYADNRASGNGVDYGGDTGGQTDGGGNWSF